MWQTGGSVTQAGFFCGFSHCIKNARRRRKGSEEVDGPNDINTSGVGIQLKIVLLEREQGKLDG